MKRRVNLSTVRAVEFVDESAFNLAHTFQVSLILCVCGYVHAGKGEGQYTAPF